MTYFGRWVALACAALYVAAEFWFNAALMDAAAAAPAARAEAVRWLEPLGRLLGGLGCTLLLGRVFGGRLAAYGLAALLSFPGMWVGQQWLVDHLADRSSAAERRHAYAAMLLADAAAAGRVRVPGIEELAGPERATLWVVLPVLATGSSLPDAVLERLHPLVERLATRTCPQGRCDCGAAARAAAARTWHESLPPTDEILQCYLAPPDTQQQRAYRAYLQAHAKVESNCSGLLVESGGCDTARSQVKAAFRLSAPAPLTAMSRQAFDAATGWPQRVRASIEELLRINRKLQPPRCASRALPDAEYAEACIRQPALADAVAAARRAISAPDAEMARSGEVASAGRNAYRSMIVLPLALTFSLFFGLLNLVALAIGAVLLVLEGLGVRQPNRAVVGAIQLVGMAALLVGVSMSAASGPAGAARSELVRRTADSTLAPPVRAGLLWLSGTQPFVYRRLEESGLLDRTGRRPPAQVIDSLIQLQRHAAWPP